MKWRECITLLRDTWLLVARSKQAERRSRIGWLDGTSGDAEPQARLTAFRQTLKTLGWLENRNVEIVTADPHQNDPSVAELLALAPDVIVSTNTPSISALIKETRAIPIVIPIMSDSVALGFAESLARPGGHVTGFTHFEPATATKCLALLREIAPSVNRIVILVDASSSTGDRYANAVEAAAVSLSLPSKKTRARDSAEIERAIGAFAREPNVGLILPPAPLHAVHRKLIVTLAGRHRLPAVYPWRQMVVDGGLMSYGPDVLELYRRAATYVDRILKGEKPADLPVLQPNKFEFAINLKTAAALGLEVPNKLRVAADEVIQ